MKKIILIGLFLSITTVLFSRQPAQCKGIKKDGNQCKMKTLDKDGYCRFHTPNIVRCAGIKKDKTQCRNIPTKDEKYCHLHKPKG